MAQHNQHQRVAVKLARKWYRVPVRVVFNSARLCKTVGMLDLTVDAESAAAAANWVRDNEPGVFDRPETEIFAWGPKGGEVQRFIGYESAVWAGMAENRKHAGQITQQLDIED